MSELKESYEMMMEGYLKFKQIVRNRDKLLYEQWKAGGFLVDEDIMSMYPCAVNVFDSLEENVADE